MSTEEVTLSELCVFVFLSFSTASTRVKSTCFVFFPSSKMSREEVTLLESCLCLSFLLKNFYWSQCTFSFVFFLSSKMSRKVTLSESWVCVFDPFFPLQYLHEKSRYHNLAYLSCSSTMSIREVTQSESWELVLDSLFPLQYLQKSVYFFLFFLSASMSTEVTVYFVFYSLLPLQCLQGFLSTTIICHHSIASWFCNEEDSLRLVASCIHPPLHKFPSLFVVSGDHIGQSSLALHHSLPALHFPVFILLPLPLHCP